MSTEIPGSTAVGGATAGTAVSASSYPVNFHVDHPASPSRFFAVPVLGFVARYLMLIPHLIALYIMYYITAIIQLFAWIPVLFTGKYPEGLYGFVSGYVGWSARVYAYLLGLSDKYPPFSLGNDPSFPAQVTFERPTESSRFYAIPILGGVVRYVLMIPHFVILIVLLAVSLLFNLVAWIPVLFAGKYPSWNYSIQSGLIRRYTRVFGFLYGLTDKYPPFGLGA